MYQNSKLPRWLCHLLTVISISRQGNYFTSDLQKEMQFQCSKCNARSRLVLAYPWWGMTIIVAISPIFICIYLWLFIYGINSLIPILIFPFLLFIAFLINDKITYSFGQLEMENK